MKRLWKCNMSFGKQLKSEFPLAPGALPLNHGSKGLPPNVVYKKFLDTIEEDMYFPDKFYFESQSKYYDEAVQELAGIVGTSYKNLAIIKNATSGVNVALNSINWSKGDKVLMSSASYGSCKNAVLYLSEKYGLEVIELDLDLQKGDEYILQQYEAALKTGVKLCLYDMASSIPAYMFPYLELTKLCKKYNTISLNDGAHGIGLEPLSLDDYKPDFYVSNLHKWYFVPRGTSFLYVDPKFHKSVQPSPISSVSPSDDDDEIFYKRFKNGASDNLATLCCVKPAKQFRESLGGDDKIWSYTKDLRDDVNKWLCDRWETELYGNVCNQMSNIVVPLKFLFSADQLLDLRSELFKSHCSMFLCIYKGNCIVRLSFQVYNEFEDYVKAIEILERAIQSLK